MEEMYVIKNDFILGDKIQSCLKSEMLIFYENTLRDPESFL